MSDDEKLLDELRLIVENGGAVSRTSLVYHHVLLANGWVAANGMDSLGRSMVRITSKGMRQLDPEPLSSDSSGSLDTTGTLPFGGRWVSLNIPLPTAVPQLRLPLVTGTVVMSRANPSLMATVTALSASDVAYDFHLQSAGPMTAPLSLFARMFYWTGWDPEQALPTCQTCMNARHTRGTCRVCDYTGLLTGGVTFTV